jgi:hypothetical protein
VGRRRRRQSFLEEIRQDAIKLVLFLVFAWVMWNVLLPLTQENARLIKLQFGPTAIPSASP